MKYHNEILNMDDFVEIDQNQLKLHFHPGWYTEDECSSIIERLEGVTYDENSQVFVFGTMRDIPRKQVAHGDAGTGYTFSGNTVTARAWNTWLQNIRDRVNAYLRQCEIIPQDHGGINFVLINYYENGEKYIGWHSDDENDLQQIGGETIIVSLTFGATRDFIFRRKDNQAQKYQLSLSNGDLLVMRGKTQQFWKHTLPKRMRVTEPRWNLTFRIMSTT